VSSSLARLTELDHWSQLSPSNDIKVARNLLVVTNVARAAEWHAMCTDPALDLLTKGNCANLRLHCRCWCRWLPASWLQSFVFGCFSLQYFTCFIVGTVSRHLHGTLRVSWKAYFCDFRGVRFQESTRNEAIEAWSRVSCLLPLAGPTRCCSRTYWTVPCRGTRGRRSYLVSGTCVLSEKIWQRLKNGLQCYCELYRRVVNSHAMTGKSHFQEVYRWEILILLG
jgi:hypothetical protein